MRCIVRWLIVSADATTLGNRFAKDAGCESAELSCLQALDVNTILNAQTKAGDAINLKNIPAMFMVRVWADEWTLTTNMPCKQSSQQSMLIRRLNCSRGVLSWTACSSPTSLSPCLTRGSTTTLDGCSRVTPGVSLRTGAAHHRRRGR